MGSRSKLSDLEKGKIIAYRDKRVSISEISRLLGRTRIVIRKFLRNPGEYGQKKSSGRPKIISECTERFVVRHVNRELDSDESNGIVYMNKVINELELQVTRWTLARVLHRHGVFKYRGLKCIPALTESQIRKRLGWVDRYLRNPINWCKVIFSDEKRFTLDGPDGYRKRWVNINRPRRFISRFASGRQGVCVWAGFSVEGRTAIAIFRDTVNAPYYQGLLFNHLLPYTDRFESEHLIFMQDNAPPHTAKSTKEFLGRQKFWTMDWPPNSPDLNPIENAWGKLTRIIYVKKRRPRSIDELELAIEREWLAIPQDYFKDLVMTMLDRMFQVLMAKGRHTGRY